MRLRPNALDALAAGRAAPVGRHAVGGRVRGGVERDGVDALQEAHEEERHLVVRELLPEADARPRVEGQEDERVRREVPMQPLIDEAVRVEFVR